jgi:hypothetical protein
VVGGEHAGEGMGGRMVLTGGPGLPVGERRERERGGAADRWGQAIRCGAARVAGPLGPGEEWGKTRARLGPETAQPRGEDFFSFFSFSVFYFTFPFFIFVSFYFLFF